MTSTDTDIDVLDAIVSAYQNLPQEQRDDHARLDAHRRISNILDVAPAASWSLEESRAVLDVLSGIVRARQAAGDVIGVAQPSN
jgi:hypothetical protein